MEKLIVVTGGSGGIGRELIKLVVSEEKLQCCAFVRDIEKFRKTVGEDCCRRVRCIVHNFEGLSDSWKEQMEGIISSEVQGITLVLTACTIDPISKAGNMTCDEIQKNITINVLSQVLLVQHMITCCAQRNLSLKIVQLDSGAAYRPICGWSLYCASKAYMSMFLRILEKEGNAKVVLYDPGVVDTEMQKKIRTAEESAFPDVELFRNYHSDGKLKAPALAAQEIYKRYILNWAVEGSK